MYRVLEASSLNATLIFTFNNNNNYNVKNDTESYTALVTTRFNGHAVDNNTESIKKDSM